MPAANRLTAIWILWGLATFVDLAAGQQQTQQIGDIQFTLPAGLQVERVAEEPLVHWPVVADWDAAGRLVVVESGGVQRPIVEHNQQRLHRVVRLLDEDGDGRFDRRMLAADKLPFAEGVLCLGQSMLVAAPPHIWKLTDHDGDGFCEDREVWFDGQTITGCANDLHGPYLGRDGWIYWCKGAFAEQTHLLLDGSTLNDHAAHIYRRRLSGGPIEPVMSGGMDNPVEVAITPEGERFFTSTFLQRPGDGRRDGIAHAVYGGVYGKENDVIDPLVRTGPLMPIMTHLGPAAPSGLLCLENNGLIEPVTMGSRVLVAALFNLQKVSAHRLVPSGASFNTEDYDLLVADRVDFHPTDVLEDADGSLIVVDTGGWYDLCCPTSRVDQKTAAGGIYRVSRPATGQTPSNRTIPDLQNLSAEECVPFLLDPRPWVSREARLKIAADPHPAQERLLGMLADTSATREQRLQALWLLGSGEAAAFSEAISTALNSGDPSLTGAACHLVALHRHQPAKSQLEALVEQRVAGNPAGNNEHAGVLRAAAEALGRIGDAETVAVLAQHLREPIADRVLEHSLLYALIEINAPQALFVLLNSQSANQRRSAMVLLNTLRPDGGELAERLHAQVLESINSEDAAEAESAVTIMGQHPEWMQNSLESIDQAWKRQLLDGGRPSHRFGALLSSWGAHPQFQSLVAEWIETSRRQADTAQNELVDLLSNYQGQLPGVWTAPIQRWLADQPQVVAKLLTHFDLSGANNEPLQAAIIQAIRDAQPDFERQLELLAALPPGSPIPDAQLAMQLVDAFLDESAENRAMVTQALLKLKLDERAGHHLLEALHRLGTRDLQVAVEAIAGTGREDLDRAMLEKITSLPAARGLSPDQLRNAYRNRSEALLQAAQAAADQLAQPSQDIERQVKLTLDSLLPGDAVRGLQVFRGNKAACSACHQMGYVGGKIGPELTRIGGSRTPEALLEAMLFPSSRIEQSFQAVRVLTVDGQVYNGLVKRSTRDALELQLTADKTIVLAVDDIEQQRPSEVSIMPAGLRELLSEHELADLMALLSTAR